MHSSHMHLLCKLFFSNSCSRTARKNLIIVNTKTVGPLPLIMAFNAPSSFITSLILSIADIP